MSFHLPWVLLALLVPLLLACWQLWRRGHPLVLPVDHAAHRDGRRLRRTVIAAELLPSALLAIAILFLAGPQRLAPPRDERILTNILFCLDVSGSMSMPVAMTVDGPKTRYDAAMEAIEAFCHHRTGDAFGLTIFGNEFLHWLPPTRELSAIDFAAPFLKPGSLPHWFGGTEIAKALDGCREHLLEAPDGDRAIILVSDGDSADFGGGRAEQTATALAAANVRLYVVLIGNPSNGIVGEIAARTGGRLFTAVDTPTLDAVFGEIDDMQKTRFRQGSAGRVDHYRPLALAGAAVLALHALAQFALRFTPW